MAARTAARTLARGLIVRGKSSNATHVVGEAVAGAPEAAAPASAIQAAREAVSSYAKKHPVIFGSMITVVKTSVADIMAQKVSGTRTTRNPNEPSATADRYSRTTRRRTKPPAADREKGGHRLEEKCWVLYFRIPVP
eukprot:scaffold412_cov311-Pavlova_lutheri.AAC.34